MAKTSKTVSYYEAVGRRRSAVARVRLYLPIKGKKPASVSKLKKGDIVVNEKPISEYYPRAVDQKEYLLPLTLTDSTDRFITSIIVKGGGVQGQLDAIKLGLARALVEVDESYRSILKPLGLLSRDARVRERRKPGTGGKARRQKQSPKR